MEISFGNMTVELNIFDISKQPPDNEDINEVNLIDSLVENHFLHHSYQDPLEACLAHSGCDFDIDELIEEVNTLLNYVPLMSINEWQPKMMSLQLSSSPPLPYTVEPPKLELKPLLDNLKYAYLGPYETLPVVIASNLE